MTDQRFWEQKIVAFLHDPPDKLLLGLGDHESRTQALLTQLLGRPPESAELELARKADSVAAAMDRAAFPAQVVVTPSDDPDGSRATSGATLYWADPEIRHPMSGCEFKDRPPYAMNERLKVSDAYKLVVDDIATRFAGDPRRMYLALWRRLPEAVDPFWRLIPGDTRMVDHSLWDHLDATTAVVGALNRPALLVLSLGPAQRYIYQARRTQDLWMGSYILSYLAWEAARAIAESIGPDAVLYPALRGQPLVDRWLASDAVAVLKQEEIPDSGRLAVAALPNKLVALVPADRARALAEDAVVPAVSAAWERMANAVLDYLETWALVDDTFREMWAVQTGAGAGGEWKSHWELYWSYHVWPATRPPGEADAWREADDVLAEYKRLAFPSFPDGSPTVPPDWYFDRVYQVYRNTKGGRLVNMGTAYSLLHTLADRAHGSRKALRDFVQVAERGEKCTLCGERAALHGVDGSRTGVRRFWGDLADELKRRQRHAELRPDGRERLCAVCTIKRFVQRAFFKKELGLEGAFPSTSTIAAATFRERLIETLKDLPPGHPLRERVRVFRDELASAQSGDGDAIPQTVVLESVPRLAVLLQDIRDDEAREAMRDLVHYDGDLFYPEAYTVERFRNSYGLDFAPEKVEHLRKCLGGLLEHAKRPSAYFAVLAMDGDEIGAWLSGERLPAFRDVLHSRAVELFEKQWARGNLQDWQGLLDGVTRRLLGPASHAAISHAVANFALHSVRPVVEDLYPGRVVYAGGDDLLALLPADSALSAARDLRALYSGQATVEVGEGDRWIRVTPELVGDRHGFLQVGKEWLVTMGPRAAISAGIAIAHHQAPLDGVVREAREALKSAKDAYGRNAVCVHALKRSGDALRVGSQWSYSGLTDVIGLFLDICERLREGKLSSRLVYDVSAESRALVAVPDAYEAELTRLIKRHGGEAVKDKAEEQAKLLASQLARWSAALEAHRQQWEKYARLASASQPDPVDEDYAPQPGCVEVGKWLQLARFLERGGAE
ncbi:MAG: type III-B CRISPR-associated protein Cas10/Cmr2 [Bacillota bacterium]|nr:type III-B CRISPR-associated protein Cas10/Cmr2 [Bacillota bacterium]